MKLNHLAVGVPNLEAARHFYESLFGMRCLEIVNQGKMLLMQDEAGSVLTLAQVPPDEEQTYPEEFHIGFVLDSAERVRQMYARAQALEAPIQHELVEWPRGIAFYLNAPGNVRLEVSYHG